MLLLVGGLVALAAIVIVVRRTVVSDGYGTRPAPRSHRDVAEVDNHGMPTKYLHQR